MQMHVPIIFTPGHFDDIAAPRNLVLPECAVSKLLEGSQEVANHGAAVRLIPQREHNVLQSVTAVRFRCSN